MSKLDVNAALSETNPVSRAAVEGPVRVVGDELIAPIVAEPQEVLSASDAVAVRPRPRGAAGPRPTGWRASRVLAAGVACLALGGTAMAATGVWNPAIGSHVPDSPPPTVSTSPVSSAMVGALGVLRREATAQDHGPEVEATLRTLGRSFDGGVLGRFYVSGVRPESVRFLEAGADGEATILFSAEESGWAFMDPEANPSGHPNFDQEGNPWDYPDGDEVCVFKPLPNGSPGASGTIEGVPVCSDLQAVLAGEAMWQEETLTDPSGEAFGLVPDGVTAITAKFSNGIERDVAVADNYWQFSWNDGEGVITEEELESGAAVGPAEIIWHDASGAVIPQQPSPTGEAIRQFLRESSRERR